MQIRFYQQEGRLMSFVTTAKAQAIGRDQAKQVANRILQWHVPVAAWNRPAYATLYRLHVASRESIAWLARLLWYEPLFRSQCSRVGLRFRMEQLPYLTGSGDLSFGDDVQLSGKSSFAFSRRHCTRPRLIVGDGCFIGHRCAIVVGRQVSIGNHCLIAGGVRISDFDGHPIDPVKRRDGETTPSECVRPVRVGDDVWLGHGAMVMKGVTIGDRSIVGARSVVTRSVPPDTIVAGNPARVVKPGVSVASDPSFGEANLAQ